MSAVDGDGFTLVLPVVPLIGIDQDAFADTGYTHAEVNDGSPNSVGVVVALEEIDGAEQHITVKVVVHERGIVVAVFIRSGTVV